jgi:leucyl-tRNA synthetase
LQESSIVKARWPLAGAVEQELVKASSYLMDTAHAFRLHLKNFLHQQRKPRKGAAAVEAVEKPTHGIVWVAKTFPPWQSAVLTAMKKLHNVSIHWLKFSLVIKTWICVKTNQIN